EGHSVPGQRPRARRRNGPAICRGEWQRRTDGSRPVAAKGHGGFAISAPGGLPEDAAHQERGVCRGAASRGHPRYNRKTDEEPVGRTRGSTPGLAGSLIVSDHAAIPIHELRSGITRGGPGRQKGTVMHLRHTTLAHSLTALIVLGLVVGG